MPDISGLITLMPYLNILWYVVWTLFFGSIAIKGFRGFLVWYIKWPLRIGLGFVAILTGIGIGALIPIAGIPLASFTKMFIGGFISGIVFAIALNVISYKMPGLIGGFEKKIEHFKNKIKSIKVGGPPKAITPARIIGISIFVGFIIFSMLYFSGFPTFENEISSMIGDLTGTDMSDLSSGCQAMTNSLYTNINIFSGGQLPDPYNDPNLQAIYQQECGETITGFFRYDLSVPIVIGSTPNQNVICLGTETEFCMRLDISQMSI